jgi:hypothetical protein
LVQVSQFGWNHPDEIVIIVPHLLHVEKISELRGKGSRQRARSHRERRKSTQRANEWEDWAGKSRINIDPMLENLGHALHIGKISGNKTVRDVKEFKLWKASKNGGDRSVESITTEERIFQPLGILKRRVIETSIEQSKFDGELDYTRREHGEITRKACLSEEEKFCFQNSHKKTRVRFDSHRTTCTLPIDTYANLTQGRASKCC